MSSRSSPQRRSNGNDRPRFIWLVIHEKLPTYSMYSRDDVYSEPIETVNAACVGVCTTHRAAAEAASQYFHEVLELGGGDDDDDDDDDDSDSETEGINESNWEACNNGGESGTWDERVHVERHEVES
jgi:hypothetical protein